MEQNKESRDQNPAAGYNTHAIEANERSQRQLGNLEGAVDGNAELFEQSIAVDYAAEDLGQMQKDLVPATARTLRIVVPVDERGSEQKVQVFRNLGTLHWLGDSAFISLSLSFKDTLHVASNERMEFHDHTHLLKQY